MKCKSRFCDTHAKKVVSWTGTAQGEQDKRAEGCGRPLTIRLRVVGRRLRVRDGGLARELLLEVPAETGREAVGRCIPKAGRHAHRASTKRGYKTHTKTHTTHTGVGVILQTLENHRAIWQCNRVTSEKHK